MIPFELQEGYIQGARHSATKLTSTPNHIKISDETKQNKNSEPIKPVGSSISKEDWCLAQINEPKVSCHNKFFQTFRCICWFCSVFVESTVCSDA